VILDSSDPLRDALAIMTAWANDADEQAFLRNHVRNLVAGLGADDREAALMDITTGLVILAGGLLKLHTAETGVTVETILRALRQRPPPVSPKTVPTPRRLDPYHVAGACCEVARHSK